MVAWEYSPGFSKFLDFSKRKDYWVTAVKHDNISLKDDPIQYKWTLKMWWHKVKRRLLLHGLLYFKEVSYHDGGDTREYYISKSIETFEKYFGAISKYEKAFVEDEEELIERDISEYTYYFASIEGVPFVISPIIKEVSVSPRIHYLVIRLNFLEETSDEFCKKVAKKLELGEIYFHEWLFCDED